MTWSNPGPQYKIYEIVMLTLVDELDVIVDTCVVLVDGDLPGVLPPPDDLWLGAALRGALQRHVAALRLNHVGAAQAVHDLGWNWEQEILIRMRVDYALFLARILA